MTNETERGSDWRTAAPDGLEAAIKRFKQALPGWWYTVGECQVSADASCGPTRESPDIAFIAYDERFDSGFHVDMERPATMAEALGVVMSEAQEAVAKARRQADLCISKFTIGISDD